MRENADRRLQLQMEDVSLSSPCSRVSLFSGRGLVRTAISRWLGSKRGGDVTMRRGRRGKAHEPACENVNHRPSQTRSLPAGRRLVRLFLQPLRPSSCPTWLPSRVVGEGFLWGKNSGATVHFVLVQCVCFLAGALPPELSPFLASALMFLALSRGSCLFGGGKRRL
ncbi:hypothetical protein CAOG_08600 [Capsaspora owczarzaki ATCC 30864]|uniref:hypothetical protein n=1 Tax=Capsaspora owczarzaki (strain ATCC 30864) TaxID=595528 RepID=UPI000352700E|nr:hypothetical protein CAOG_08600 [Capsaspora owczarzaki ATCC 30864]|eukprot:XP_011270200.1 hypothetical protein CAOG_08600 [Capsaspora owczarzaki ATCC 30864]